jgi:hypothetical protein
MKVPGPPGAFEKISFAAFGRWRIFRSKGTDARI